MSRQNVEIVRRGYEAATERPKPDFATVNALFDPDHEFVSMLSGLDGDSFRGAGGFREWLTSLAETWESYEWQLEEASEIDEHRVLLVAVILTRTHRGSVPMQQRLGCAITVREGKIVRSETHTSRKKAIQAAGLPG